MTSIDWFVRFDRTMKSIIWLNIHLRIMELVEFKSSFLKSGRKLGYAKPLYKFIFFDSLSLSLRLSFIIFEIYIDFLCLFFKFSACLFDTHLVKLRLYQMVLTSHLRRRRLQGFLKRGKRHSSLASVAIRPKDTPNNSC